MVMLDYRDSPAPVVEPAPTDDPPRPIRRTITLGKNNPDRAYENESAPNNGDAPYEPAQSPQTTATYSQTYYGGYSGYAPYGANVPRGGAAGGGHAPGAAGGPGSVATPPVGGDWPAPRNYGPAPVRSRTQP
jgi:hypothetical protein